VYSDIENKHRDVSEDLKWIARGPSMHPIKWDAYNVNGRRFNTKSRDENRVNQNSGVSIVADTMQVTTAKDKHPVHGNMTYYGVIQQIWELDYVILRVPVFKCDWVHQGGVSHDDLGFILVNLSRLGHKDEPFILASQANPVFYVDDPLNKHLSVVLSSDPRGIHTEEDDEVEELEELSTPHVDVLECDGFDCTEATTGSYLRDDGVKGHVIKHRPQNTSINSLITLDGIRC
jgi:hypothetical protein